MALLCKYDNFQIKAQHSRERQACSVCFVFAVTNGFVRLTSEHPSIHRCHREINQIWGTVLRGMCVPVFGRTRHTLCKGLRSKCYLNPMSARVDVSMIRQQEGHRTTAYGHHVQLHLLGALMLS